MGDPLVGPFVIRMKRKIGRFRKIRRTSENNSICLLHAICISYSFYLTSISDFDNWSRTMALITNCMKSKLVIYINLGKALDTIDHSILWKKFAHIGFRNMVLKWVGSYLANTKKYVDFNNRKSLHKQVDCGVPLGSIVAPKLFILYFNGICNVSVMLRSVLFAGDTNIFCSHNDITI